MIGAERQSGHAVLLGEQKVVRDRQDIELRCVSARSSGATSGHCEVLLPQPFQALEVLFCAG